MEFELQNHGKISFARLILLNNISFLLLSFNYVTNMYIQIDLNCYKIKPINKNKNK